MKFYPKKLCVVVMLSSLSAMSHAALVDSILVDSTDMSDIGFKLTGKNASLTGNDFMFPEEGHYCARKYLSVDLKAGDNLSVEIDELEALQNGVALNILTWGEGQYKGFGGATGTNQLTGELTFDATTVAVGFCRYNNKDFEEFEISEFSAFQTLEEIDVVEATSVIPPVYESCREYTQGSGSTVLIVDDSEPRTLQELFDDGTIQPGMVVILRRQEGSLELDYKDVSFTKDDADWLTIYGENGASIESIKISSVKNIRFSGLKISKDQSGYLVDTYNTRNIILDNNFISGGDDYQTWDAQKWQEVRSGIIFNRAKCSTAYKNEMENLRMGITTYTYDDNMTQEVQSLKVLIKDNFIRNISADFFRPIGTDITIDGNTGLDSYVSEDDGDPNHDDFVQGFAYPIGTEFQNVKITNNFYQSSTDASRPYQSPGQGIAFFDGLYTNFEISNNTIISDMYHGVTVFWGRDGLIKNNTMTVLNDTSKHYMWVQSTYDKTGKYAPENVIVENNVANGYSLHSNTAALANNNVTITREEVAANLEVFNQDDLIFDTSVKEDSVYHVEGTGSDVNTIEKSLESFLK